MIDPPQKAFKQVIIAFKRRCISTSNNSKTFALTYYNGPAIDNKGKIDAYFGRGSTEREPLEEMMLILRMRPQIYSLNIWDCPRPLLEFVTAGIGASGEIESSDDEDVPQVSNLMSIYAARNGDKEKCLDLAKDLSAHFKA